MASLTNYSDLQEAIQDYLERTDLAPQTAAYFITLAEATLNKVVRSTRMVVDTTVSVPGGGFNGPLPADCLEPVYLAGTTPGAPLKHISADKLAELRLYRFRRQGTPRFYAIVGRALELCPAPVAAMSVDLRYYQVIPALASTQNGSNWLLQYAPELYLYAALLHALPLLKDDDRQAILGNNLAQMLGTALAENARITLDDNQPPAITFGPPKGSA